MTINYFKPLVACNVILLALCGYLIFQNQQLQSSQRGASSHVGAPSQIEGQVEVSVEDETSLVNESRESSAMQFKAADMVAAVAETADEQSTLEGLQPHSPGEEELVSEQLGSEKHIAAAALFQNEYSSTKEKLESLLASSNYQ